MRNRITVCAGVLALLLLFVACGGNTSVNSSPDNHQAANPPANTESPPPDNKQPDVTEKPDEPDKPDEPEKPDAPEDLGDVPEGELEDHGLVFTIPFKRGEGSVVFSRQNDYLRVEIDARLPYSGGDGARIQGSSVDLVLSVDGLNGRHLFYYPQPLWVDLRGRPKSFRVEASYSAEKDGPPSVVSNPSFVGEGDVAYWDRWIAVMWVDLRHVLVPGNSPGSVSDTWCAGLIVGNDAASEAFPKGLDRYNPGKTPDRLVQFKVSELPELDELDEDPKERLRTKEESAQKAMQKISAQLNLNNPAGCFETANEWLTDHPEDLWAHYLKFLLALQLNVDPNYDAICKDYVDACPGQSTAHIAYWDVLQRKDRHADAKAHAETVFESGLSTGRLLTEAHMRLEWAKVCTNWGQFDEIETQRKLIEEHPEMLKDNDFRVQFKMQAADVAAREGDSATVVEIYDAIFKEEYKYLGAQRTQEIQQLTTMHRSANEAWKKELELREADKAKTNPRLTIETSKGTIVVELFEDDAPNTTASLVSLAQKNFWDGLNFHRVEPNFVVQGGCPNGDGSGGPGYRTKFESNNRRHFRGSFAMARSQSIDSQGSQFYICVSNSPSVLSLSDNKYLVVGRVLEGMDVVDKIRAGDKITSIKVDNLRDHEYEPETLEE